MTHAEEIETAGGAAWLRARAIIADMAGTPPNQGGAAYCRRQAERLAECLDAIYAEAAMLSAGVCPHLRGNEHGNAYCARTDELI